MASSSFHGRWALVTGASSGIGAELARQLADRGANLILTARRRDRLEALAAELAPRGVQIRIVVADLSHPAAPRQIYQATEGAGIPVDILINNAGLGQYGNFFESPLEQELNQVRVNCEAVIHVTRLFLPRMVERRRGWILVVASTASFQPVPYITTYSATKVFDRFFAQGLAEEVSRFGINVTALCPGPTESEFFDVARANKFKGRVQATDVVARVGLDALERGKRTVLPDTIGRIRTRVVPLLPIRLITWFVDRVARPTQ